MEKDAGSEGIQPGQREEKKEVKKARGGAENDKELWGRRQSARTKKSDGLLKNDFPNEVLESLDLPKEEEMPAGYNASDDSEDDYKLKGKKTSSSEDDSDTEED